MFNFYLIFLMLFSSIATHSAYIDTRDMSSESARIQRLLGQLDALNISTTQRSSSSSDGTKIAMLTLMTTGLAVSVASSSSYRRYGYAPPVRTYNKPYYYRRPRPSRGNDAAAAIGTTMAVAGAVGLIASEIAEEQARKEEEARQESLQKIELEINTIISNLVSTDTDFISDSKILDEKLSYTADKNILEIAATTSNTIQALVDKETKMNSDFVHSTNSISTELFEYEKHTTEAISYNIHMMDGSSKDNELKRLNSTLEKNMQTKQKDAKKELDRLVKDYNRNFPKLQANNKPVIAKLKDTQNTSILKEVENIATQKSKLFQIYIDQYIRKLSAY